GQLAGEFAANFSDIDKRGSGQRSRLIDLHLLAVHGRFHVTLDDEHVAVGDLHAFELDVHTDEELAAAPFGGYLTSSRRAIGRRSNLAPRYGGPTFLPLSRRPRPSGADRPGRGRLPHLPPATVAVRV